MVSHHCKRPNKSQAITTKTGSVYMLICWGPWPLYTNQSSRLQSNGQNGRYSMQIALPRDYYGCQRVRLDRKGDSCVSQGPEPRGVQCSANACVHLCICSACRMPFKVVPLMQRVHAVQAGMHQHTDALICPNPLQVQSHILIVDHRSTQELRIYTEVGDVITVLPPCNGLVLALMLRMDPSLGLVTFGKIYKGFERNG